MSWAEADMVLRWRKKMLKKSTLSTTVRVLSRTSVKLRSVKCRISTVINLSTPVAKRKFITPLN